MKNQVRLRDNRVAVEKLKKQTKKADTFFVAPESDEFLGTIRFLGNSAASDLKVGDKVYFGNQHQQVKMIGADMCIMTDDNILAVVTDDEEKPESN